jgi:hypothetical protein
MSVVWVKVGGYTLRNQNDGNCKNGKIL